MAALEDGRYRYNAANLAGIGERTLKEWIARGRAEVDAQELAELHGQKTVKAIGPFGEFYLEVALAEAKAEDEALGVIVSIALDPKAEGRDRLKAAMWYLERKHPRRYGSAVRHEHAGPDGGPIEVDARDTLKDRLAGLAKKAAKAGA